MNYSKQSTVELGTQCHPSECSSGSDLTEFEPFVPFSAIFRLLQN